MNKKEGVKGKCFFCGKESGFLEIHHFKQKSLGGEDIDENRVHSCWDCHHKIIHKKVNHTGYTFYWVFYYILSHALGITPIKDGYDYDLNYAKDISSIKNLDDKFKKFALSMLLFEHFLFDRDIKDVENYLKEIKEDKV